MAQGEAGVRSPGAEFVSRETFRCGPLTYPDPFPNVACRLIPPVS